MRTRRTTSREHSSAIDLSREITHPLERHQSLSPPYLSPSSTARAFCHRACQETGRGVLERRAGSVKGVQHWRNPSPRAQSPTLLSAAQWQVRP